MSVLISKDAHSPFFDTNSLEIPETNGSAMNSSRTTQSSSTRLSQLKVSLIGCLSTNEREQLVEMIRKRVSDPNADHISSVIDLFAQKKQKQLSADVPSGGTRPPDSLPVPDAPEPDVSNLNTSCVSTASVSSLSQWRQSLRRVRDIASNPRRAVKDVPSLSLHTVNIASTVPVGDLATIKPDTSSVPSTPSSLPLSSASGFSASTLFPCVPAPVSASASLPAPLAPIVSSSSSLPASSTSLPVPLAPSASRSTSASSALSLPRSLAGTDPYAAGSSTPLGAPPRPLTAPLLTAAPLASAYTPATLHDRSNTYAHSIASTYPPNHSTSASTYTPAPPSSLGSTTQLCARPLPLPMYAHTTTTTAAHEANPTSTPAPFTAAPRALSVPYAQGERTESYMYLGERRGGEVNALPPSLPSTAASMLSRANTSFSPLGSTLGSPHASEASSLTPPPPPIPCAHPMYPTRPFTHTHTHTHTNPHALSPASSMSTCASHSPLSDAYSVASSASTSQPLRSQITSLLCELPAPLEAPPRSPVRTAVRPAHTALQPPPSRTQYRPRKPSAFPPSPPRMHAIAALGEIPPLPF